MFRGLATEGIDVDRIRVVLADDHREVIAKIRGILGDDFEVIEAAENGRQAVTAVLALDPDVFVTDISMPILNGLQAARSIQKNKFASEDHILNHSRRSGLYRRGVLGRCHRLRHQAPPVDGFGPCDSRGAQGPRLCVQFDTELSELQHRR